MIAMVIIMPLTVGAVADAVPDAVGIPVAGSVSDGLPRLVLPAERVYLAPLVVFTDAVRDGAIARQLVVRRIRGARSSAVPWPVGRPEESLAVDDCRVIEVVGVCGS